MHTPALVSIIVPVYNVEKYLPRCLDSLIAQTLNKIEIICVDDGSSDDSLNILNDYAQKEPRLKVLRQSNQGVSAARNAALGAAVGRYAAFVDPDDWLDPQTCLAAAELMVNDLQLDYVAFSTNIIMPDDDSRSQEAKTLGERYNVKFKGKQKLDSKIKLDTVPNVCHKILKMCLIKDYNLKFPSGVVGEDGGFWYKFAAHSKYGYYLEDKFYNYFRGRSEAATKNMGQKNYPQFNWLLIFEDVYRHYKIYGLIEEANDFLAKIFVKMYLADMAITRDQDALRVFARQMCTQLNLPNQSDNIIKYLQKGINHERAAYGLGEKIFSIKNRGFYKIISILGLEFKIKRKGK